MIKLLNFQPFECFDLLGSIFFVLNNFVLNYDAKIVFDHI